MPDAPTLCNTDGVATITPSAGALLYVRVEQPSGSISTTIGSDGFIEFRSVIGTEQSEPLYLTVPEPGSTVGLAAGVAMLLLVKRFGRRQHACS